MGKKKKQPQSSGGSHKIRIRNRRAWHDYHVEEKVECGIVLTGTEVKSLRQGNAKIDDAYARISGGEVWLVGAHIAPYPQAAEGMQHQPDRKRKLLLHRRQIAQLEALTRQKGKTIIPLEMKFKKGWAKVELGVAVGKKQYDKRQDLKKRDHQREMKRAMRRR